MGLSNIIDSYMLIFAICLLVLAVIAAGVFFVLEANHEDEMDRINKMSKNNKLD